MNVSHVKAGCAKQLFNEEEGGEKEEEGGEKEEEGGCGRGGGEDEDEAEAEDVRGREAKENEFEGWLERNAPNKRVFLKDSKGKVIKRGLKSVRCSGV